MVSQNKSKLQKTHEKMTQYRVKKISASAPLCGNWGGTPWRNVKAATLTNFLGPKPSHFPHTQFKAVYDDDSIRVIFRVNDKYVKAIRTKRNSWVYKDSCVEFFFTPGIDVSKGYFNLEMNCCGAYLFHFQKTARKNMNPIDGVSCRKIQKWHSFNGPVMKEIEKPVTWIVEYTIPFSILEKYTPVTRPKPGVKWRANLYKIASGSSHPHYLTWSPIHSSKIDFHVPEFFGVLKF